RIMTAEEQVTWNAAYDSALLYLDGELGRVLDALQRHPRFDETLVVITSDHGEAFGEHGLFRHSTALYDEMLAVPLFLKPGARRPAGFLAGRSLPGPFQPVDLFPTLLDHAGLPVPAGLDGYAWGGGRRAVFAESYPHPPVASLGARFRRELRAVEQDGWKLIVSSAGEVELYDLVHDPGETRNVAAAYPGRAAEMGRLLGEKAMSGTPARPGGRESDELVKALRSLGYVP
ncbi:MAG TPA: sulfatase-like hydrolase/transferase, partial [Thermoanaerobaculia bacterium]|nr:sulfatase-like hydrolase/transferase [Thermoanaerobaculia bacterium]